jgi:hypothetical protein
MHRDSNNWQKYKQTCEQVIERASECCEVMIDENGSACSDLPKSRCGKMIPHDQARTVNFLHKATRNGKPDEWVLSPDNIIFGCESHHFEESETGKHCEMCDYSEVMYIPE